MTNEFSHLNLHPKLVQAVAELGYTTPTDVQAQVIPDQKQQSERCANPGLDPHP